MKLSRTVTYALKATLQLAQTADGPPVPCSRLAAQGAMPERFLLQILRSLVTHGILKSTRGVDGGYVLVHDPATVSVLDVMEAIDGPMTHEATFGEGLPTPTRDLLVNVMEEVNTTMRDRLSGVKLADLVPQNDVTATGSNANNADATANADATPTCQTPAQSATVRPRVDQPSGGSTSVPAPVITSPPHVFGSVNSVPSVNSDR